MLICALLARLGQALGREDFVAAADAGVRTPSPASGRTGPGPTARSRDLDWVDGFHTGYVLDSLLTCVQAGVGGAGAEEAWRRGLRFYAERADRR